MTCDICDGRRFIRLPVRRPASAARFKPEDEVEISASYHDFPCPQCRDHTDGSVELSKAVTFSDEFAHDSDFMESVKYSIANRIARAAFERGLIKFEDGVRSPFVQNLRGRMRVVPP